jgi:protein tyrosine phosphatase (PTP) superfamily phosphohydrolase (DUF442 family)
MTRKSIRRIQYLLLVGVLAVGVYEFWPMLRGYVTGEEAGETLPKSQRPATWAQKLDRPHLENLHHVSDDLYRGAQPSEEGMRELKKMGIRTVVNLREYHSDTDEIGETGLDVVDIPMAAWDPEDDHIVRFLEVVGDPKRRPVFVHCQYGSDRTGTMCAIYRIVLCGWSKAEAVREMTRGGFGFHGIFRNLPQFIDALDVEEAKRRAGIEPAPAAP